MPQFIAQHIPDEPKLDAFTAAYLEAAEWLWSEEPEEGFEDCEGWSPDAIKEACEDCKNFQTANARALRIAAERYGFSDEQAGHDFWLTRNHHGAGFWDRGIGRVGKVLTDAAHAFGEIDSYVGDDSLAYFS